MADVTYRFAGIPDGIVASVFSVDDLETEVTTVEGTQSGANDADLPVGDYVAIWRDGTGTHNSAGDLATRPDSDYADSGTGTSAAADVTYDNTTSELTAEDVQAALDELTARVAALETP